MTITTLRPSSDSYKQGITYSAGSTIWSLVADAPDPTGDDTSYISASNGVQYPTSFWIIHIPNTVVVATNQRVKALRFRPRIRISAAASGNSAGVGFAFRNPYSGVTDQIETFRSASTVAATQTGIWRTRPPRDTEGHWSNTEWTKTSVDATQLYGAFYYSAGSHVNLRLTEIFVDVDIRTQPTISSVVVTGQTATTTPLVTWVYVPNADNDPQITYQVKVFTSSQYGSSSFNADTTTPAWDSGEIVGTTDNLTVGTALVNGATYRAYVRAAQDFNSSRWYSTWVPSDAFSINLNPPAIPSLSVTSDSTVPNLRNVLTVQGNINLLSADDASLDTTIGTWVNDTNSAVARTTSQAAYGVGSLQMTASSAATMSAKTATGLLGYKVLTGTTYTFLASFKAGSTGRTCKVGALFFDRSGVAIGPVAYGTGVADTSSGWTQVSYSVAAPAGAVFVSVYVQVTSPANAEVHYVDKMLVGTNVTIGGGGGSVGVTPPVVAQVQYSGAWQAPSGAVTVTGVPAGALLVAITSDGDANASQTSHTVTNTGAAVLTWTKRQETDGAGLVGDSSVHTANVATAGDYTVTASSSNVVNGRLVVYVITGHDENPFGGASNKSQATSSAPTVSLTTTRDNSLVIGALGDWNESNPNNRVYRNAPVVEDLMVDFGQAVNYHWHYIRATAGTSNDGLTAPATQAYGMTVIEVRGITGASAQSGWSPGGGLGTIATVVERSLVSSGPRNLITPQQWSGGDTGGNASGFFASGTNSRVAYDPAQWYNGAGSIRWDVNNLATKLYIGWIDVPNQDPAPLYALSAIPGKTYTFGMYAKADATFSSQLNLQAIDQDGILVGSSVNGGAISITTGWVLYTATITVPAGAVYVRPSLDNTASAVERHVWVDGLQWVIGSSADAVPAPGRGMAMIWEAVRGADVGELLLTGDPGDQVKVLYDHEAPPGYTVTYRAWNLVPPVGTTTPGQASDTTTYLQTMLTSPGAGYWILRNPLDPTVAMRVHVVDISEAQKEDASEFHPLRPTAIDGTGQRPVVVSDYMGGHDGTLTMLTDSEAEWLMLKDLLAAPRALWLVFPAFGGRHIRITDRGWTRTTPRTGFGTDSVWRRTITVPFVETDRD